MSEDRAGAGPTQSVWSSSVPPPVRHSYGLAVRSHSLGTAIGLLLQSLPFAFARFGILLAYTVTAEDRLA